MERPIDLKKMYKDYLATNAGYYEKHKNYDSPDDMYSQYLHRHDILCSLIDFSFTFPDHARHVIEAFREYEEKKPPNGRGLMDILPMFVEIVAGRENIKIWENELSEAIKYMDEINLRDMEKADLV